MDSSGALLEKWQSDERAVRERERWHALWLLAQGWSEAQVARALERDAHTIGAWVNAFGAAGPRSLAFEQTGGSPPPSTWQPKPR
jgi:transposase